MPNSTQCIDPSLALLLTEPEAAKFLSVCPRTLGKLAESGHINPVYLGRAKRYDRRDLIAMIDTQKDRSSEAMQAARLHPDSIAKRQATRFGTMVA